MRSPLLVIAPVLLGGLLALPSPAEELPKAEGLDVVRAARAIAEAVGRPEAPVARGKAWEHDIAGLTDPRPEVHTQAMAALIRRGQPVVGDLTLLSGDPEAKLRARVAAVLAAIGGEDATVVVLRLSSDAVKEVAEVATMGLGKARGSGSFARLAEVLRSPDPDLRQAAARGMSLHGDPQALGLLCGYPRDRDDLVRRDMRESLGRVALQPQAVPVLGGLIASRSGDERLALIEATSSIGDPRLSPVLAEVVTGPDARAAAMAAQMLSVNGDSRAVAALCRAAAQGRDALLRECAAETLQHLTGHRAAAGIAWELWWRDHAQEVAALEPRDRLLADLHDPGRNATRDELAAFSVSALAQLVDGALGQGAPWWPARAFAALAADAPGRWTAALLARIDATLDNHQRVRLIILLDQLGDPGARDGLQRLYRSLDDQPAVKAAAMGPERIALGVALERRGVTLP
jgi:HEAT repeat protein